MLRKALTLCLALWTAPALAQEAIIGSGVFGDAHVGVAGTTVISPHMVSMTSAYTTSTTYIPTTSQGPNGNSGSGTEAVVSSVIAVAGTFKNLSCATIGATPGTALNQGTWTFTFQHNHVATSLACALTNAVGQATDSTAGHFFSVAAGDTVSVQSLTSGSPTNPGLAVSWLFVPTNTGESSIESQSSPSNLVANDYYPLGWSIGTGNATETTVSGVVPFNMTIDEIAMHVRTAPGAGTSWTATLWSGTCGSVATSSLAVTVANAATDGQTSAGTNAVSLTAGQCWSIQLTASGSPAASAGSFAVREAPGPAGYYPTFVSGASAIGTNGSIRYCAPAGSCGSGQTTYPPAANLFVDSAGSAWTTATAETFYYIQNTNISATSTATRTVAFQAAGSGSIISTGAMVFNVASGNSSTPASITSLSYVDVSNVIGGTGNGAVTTWYKASLGTLLQ